jgi:S1-C subfamily serine protease
MNLFDLGLILLAVIAAVGGYRLGFLLRVVSWAGLALGVLVGVLVLPRLMERVHNASDASLVLIAVATLLGCSLIGQGIGLAIGTRLRIALPHGPARHLDRAAGAAAGIVGVLVALWLLFPTLSAFPGATAEQVRGSLIAREVHERFPPAPDAIQALRRMVGDPFPEVLDPFTRAPDPGPPPASTGISQAVADQVVRSTVKVEGVACRRVQEGSGFVLAPDLIVTNAHVVAGENETQVRLLDGTVRDATVVAYDHRRDLAVLRVPNLGLPALGQRDAVVGDLGGVFGYPGGGPLEISPFGVADQISAVGTDIYDRERTTRQVLVLAAELAPGDSGGALVDAEGNVIGVAFAVAPDRRNVAYALSLEELRAVLAASNLNAPSSTGACLV